MKQWHSPWFQPVSVSGRQSFPWVTQGTVGNQWQICKSIYPIASIPVSPDLKTNVILRTASNQASRLLRRPPENGTGWRWKLRETGVVGLRAGNKEPRHSQVAGCSMLLPWGGERWEDAMQCWAENPMRTQDTAGKPANTVSISSGPYPLVAALFCGFAGLGAPI